MACASIFIVGLLTPNASAQEFLKPFRILDQEILNKYKELYRETATGDSFDPATGEVTFAVTDVSIPGNSALPVELSRWIPADDFKTGGFVGSAWQWDIPLIKANYMNTNPYQNSGQGIVTISPGGWRGGKHCTEKYSTSIHVANQEYSHVVEPWFYWEGKQLHIPGKTTEKFLESSQADGTVRQITKSNYVVTECTSISPGIEGFKVKGPDGTTYTFGQLKNYYTGAASPTPRSPLTTFTTLVMVTEIRDRFGNTVTYNYNAQGNLSSIVGSDGREIKIYYKTYTYKGGLNYIVDYVTANGKTWSYLYTDWIPDASSSDTRKFLSGVNLPDGSSWKYDNVVSKLAFDATKSLLSSNYHPQTGANVPGYCQARSTTSFSTTVVNPDGLTTAYTFKPTYHGRSKVNPQSTVEIDTTSGIGAGTIRRARNLNCSISNSLVSKAISGQGIASQQWTYEYSQNTGTYTTTDTSPSIDLNQFQAGPFAVSFSNGIPDNIVSANDYRAVTVTGPDSKTVHYVDRRFQSPTEGSVVTEDYLNKSTGGLLKRVEKNKTQGAYVGAFWFVDSTSFDAPTRLSLNANQIQYQINLAKVRTKLYLSDGTDIYDTEYQNYDHFGYPEKTVESNQFSTKKRYTKQYYLHDQTNWILGLPTLTQLSSSDSDYTTVREIVYHTKDNTNLYENLALPYEYKSFGTWIRRYPEFHGDGQVKKIEYNQPIIKADGTFSPTNYRYQLLTDYKRGIAQKIETTQRYILLGSMTFSRTVSDDGWIKSITDLNGVTAHYDYDSMGRLKSIDLPDNWADAHIEWTQLANSPIKRIARTCLLASDRSNCAADSITREETAEFDALYRIQVSQDTDMLDSVSRFENYDYNSEHLPTFNSFTSISSTENTGTTNGYDNLGRLISTTTTDGGTVSTDYLAGNKIRVTDARGYATTTTYLAYGAPDYSKALIISSPESVTTTQAINIFGDILSITQSGPGKDGVGTLSQTEYRVYDSMHHLCKTSRSDTGVSVFSNSVLGEVQWFAQGIGGGTTSDCTSNATSAEKVLMRYDNLGEIWQINYPDNVTYPAPDSIYTRDNNGNVKSLVAGNVSQAYHYNILGLVEDETVSVGGKVFTLDYGYNAAGQLSSLTYPDGDRINFSPNAYGQARQAVRQARTGRSQFTYAESVKYYPNAMIDTFTYGNTLTHKTVLNSRKLVQLIDDRRTGYGALTYSYTYDNNDRMTSITDLIMSSFSIKTLNYNGLGQLVSTTGNFGAGSTSMRYDGLGNITYKQNKKHSLDYAYDSNNRLAFVVGSKPYDSFVYDGRGNVVSNSYRGFVYNLANQMVESAGNTYSYDGHGRRVISKEGSRTNYSVYSQSGQLLYTEGPEGGVNYIYLGKKLIAKDGVVLRNSAKQHFFPFGTSIEGEKDDVGYTGHKYDGALSLSYMQARYYDPVLGRFYSNDPIGFLKDDVSTFNRYSYVGNDPINMVDPTGEARKIAWVINLGASATRKLARITQQQAVNIRQSGGNVLADSRQMAKQIETAAHGKDNLLKHRGHELPDGSVGKPHFQTDGSKGHTFWGVVTATLLGAADMLDKAAYAADLIEGGPLERMNDDLSAQLKQNATDKLNEHKSKNQSDNSDNDGVSFYRMSNTADKMCFNIDRNGC
jgi:RHS repeat-associated protein